LRRVLGFSWIAVVLLALANAFAQEVTPAPDAPITTLKLGTKLVSVSALVLDKSGNTVSGLTKDDFTLKQDGKPQEVRFFSQGSDRPLTLALMVDTSGSQRDFIADETAASQLFFPAVLTHPGDRAVLVQFDFGILELQRMTGNTVYLERALTRLSQPHAVPQRPPQSGGGWQGHHFGGTLLYDAICAVAGQELMNQTGRRAMVLLTDGGDNGSTQTLDTAKRCAQAADTVIYSVFYSDPDGHSGRKDVLDDLSKATGGQVFTVSPKMTLEQIYTAIAEDMRLQYQLGYRPPDSKPKKFHKIEVQVKDKHLKVQAREGFYSPD